jgi:hypothetical protein
VKRFIQLHQTFLFVCIMTAVFASAGISLLKNMTEMTVTTTIWNTDFEKHRVALDEFVPVSERDAMVPIDDPRWERVSRVNWLGDFSPVIVVHLAEPARAYPLIVLMNHGIVNDRIQDVPIAVTFCTLCNSPMVFKRMVNGQELRFGTSGAIRNSGLVMWDDQTQSWWQQLTGEAMVGAYSGTRLETVPSQVVGYQTFAQAYPDGVVLAGDQYIADISYGRNPYLGYDSNSAPFMYDGVLDTRLLATERVLASNINGYLIAYPFSVLQKVYVVNDQIGELSVAVFWQQGANSTQDQANIDDSKDVGMAMLFSRVVDGRVLTFYYANGRIWDEETQSQWNILGQAVSGTLMGNQLVPYSAYPYFWFAWSANYPNSDIYGQ